MKIKALLYCTKSKPYLQVNRCVLPTEYDRYILSKEQYYSAFGEPLDKLNGKIVAECDYEFEEIIPESWNSNINYWYSKELLKASCLDALDLRNYLQFKNGKAIHIENLNIFDKPRELSDCHKIIAVDDADFNENDYKYVSVIKAPHNMMKVWLYENGEWVMYILIPVSSQEMYRIANKEQTTLVRKIVLKEANKNE